MYIKRSLKKCNTAHSANLHALVYTLLYRKVPQQVVYMVHCRKTNSAVVACGAETQQELIPFKHKESWVVELALSELTVTELEGMMFGS